MPAPKDPEKRKLWIENLSKSHIGLKRKSFTQKTKDKMSNSKIGKNHPKYKGKEYKDKNGRWYIWINRIKYVRARYIAEQYLYRKLTDSECVHHINEDKSDDRPENLYVFATNGEHVSQHHIKNPSILTSNILY